MIKIIKEGTRKIENCPNCGCEFSYEREDIEKDGLFLQITQCLLGKLGLYVRSAVKKLY